MNDPVVRLAARGDAVTASGAFVAGGVPGDHVTPDGALVRGPHHQAPACKHFGKCGGCQLQHVDDVAYADFLVERITSALHAQGLDVPEMRTPILSPAGARRRVSLKAFRQGKRITLGFSEAGSHKLVDLQQCPVMHPTLHALIGPVRILLASLMKDRRPAEVRMTLADQGVDLMISGGAAEGLEATEALADFAAKHKLARLSLDEGYGPQIRWEPDHVTIMLSGVAVGLPEGAFLQATADGETALVAAVRSIVGDAAEVADLFAGLGTFTFAVPGRVSCGGRRA